MHGFIGDDLVKQGGRRIPINLLENQETTVEPAAQQKREIKVTARQFRRIFHQAQKVDAHVHEICCCPAWLIESAQQFASFRGRDFCNAGISFGRARFCIFGCQISQGPRIDVKLVVHELKERQFLVVA